MVKNQNINEFQSTTQSLHKGEACPCLS